MHAYCSCKKFEFEGIPCHHALSVMVRLSIRMLPERYILKQWTKGVTKVHSTDNGVEVGSYGADSIMAKHRYISSISTPIFTEGCQSKEGFEVLVNAHSKLQMKLRNLKLDIPSEASMHPWNGLDSDVVEYQELPEMKMKPSFAATRFEDEASSLSLVLEAEKTEVGDDEGVVSLRRELVVQIGVGDEALFHCDEVWG
ncbi:hypothetical protein MRB53_010005 [Persea americana]|uniref:Uncharacterized protein n=1 Tax=Persea americana TaxID=3435 RepID=A0ACC2LQP4_PERAE|nr:hypothetical protein MRB53_010005 [Persea americana]